jgi:hypothetical protein
MFLVHEVVLDARFFAESTIKFAVVVALNAAVLFWVAMPLVDDKVVRKNEEAVSGEKELEETGSFVRSVSYEEEKSFESDTKTRNL